MALSLSRRPSHFRRSDQLRELQTGPEDITAISWTWRRQGGEDGYASAGGGRPWPLTVWALSQARLSCTCKQHRACSHVTYCASLSRCESQTANNVQEHFCLLHLSQLTGYFPSIRRFASGVAVGCATQPKVSSSRPLPHHQAASPPHLTSHHTANTGRHGTQD